MKYCCDVPGLEHNFIEFSDRWSKAERQAFRTLGGSDDKAKHEEWLTLYRSKIVALHLDCIGAEPITTPDHITDEYIDRMDLVVFEWLKYVGGAHLDHLSSLGKVTGLRLYAANGDSAAQAKQSPMPSPTPGS